MQYSFAWSRAWIGIFAFFAMAAAPAALQAQTYDPLPQPIGPVQVPRPPHHGWLFNAGGPAIPRTYSYYYNTWFNQPCHFKVIGPDGCVRWRTTVRGLPLGTPWPSNGVGAGELP